MVRLEPTDSFVGFLLYWELKSATPPGRGAAGGGAERLLWPMELPRDWPMLLEPTESPMLAASRRTPEQSESEMEMSSACLNLPLLARPNRFLMELIDRFEEGLDPDLLAADTDCDDDEGSPGCCCMVGWDALRGRDRERERLRPNNDGVDAEVAVAGRDAAPTDDETDCELLPVPGAFLFRGRDRERLRLRPKKELLFSDVVAGNDAADTDCDEEAVAGPLTLLLPLMNRLDRDLERERRNMDLLSSVRTEMSSLKLRGIVG